MSELDSVLTSAPLAPLRGWPQWIVVKLVPKSATKDEKFPVDTRTGRVTEKGTDGAHNPEIWLDCATAVATATRYGPGYTVGFVLTAADPFWVLDVDNARQPDDSWSLLAQQLCAALPGTVVEVSQSSRGLHVWGQGPVPEHRNRRDELGLEFYSKLRLIAIGTNAVGDMTQPCPTIAQFLGNVFPPRLTVAEVPATGPRAEWRGPTDDDELIRRALASRSASSVFNGGASFADLWNAEAAALARNYPSSSGDAFDRSSADAALTQHLAFWTGCDQQRMAALLQRSQLNREKWEREDYLARTIANACGLQRDVLQDKAQAEGATKALAMASRDEVLGRWVELAKGMPPADVETFVQFVHARTQVGVRALKAELKEARAADRLARTRQEFAERAKGRVTIEHQPEVSTLQAAQVEAAILAAAKPGEYVSFSGVLSRVTSKPLPFTHLIDRPEEAPPSVPQIEPLDKVTLLERAEPVAAFFERQRSGAEKLIAIPDRILDALLSSGRSAAPVVSGLLTHPIALRSGEILTGDGVLHETGLFVAGANVTDVRPYTQPEAVAALGRLRALFLEGYEFATALDADVALAGLFTGVERRLMDVAPGLAVLANTQSSGKTTLARCLHIVLTGRDMPASTYPLGNEAEAGKQLLSMLLKGPAMVCFDNVPDGFNFHSAVLATAMTSASIDQRVLGVSRTANPATNVLFAMTGNNVSLGNDEVSRWLVTRLAPRGGRPEERRFRNPDVVAHALSVRAQVLRDVVGIVAGFRVGGARLPDGGTRFQAWNELVRGPLLWAGASDVAAVFRANAAESGTVRAQRGLLWGLLHAFGDRDFSAAEVVGATLLAGSPEVSATLREALDGLPVKDAASAKSVGRLLAGLEGKAMDVQGVDFKITGRPNAANTGKRYQVVRA